MPFMAAGDDAGDAAVGGVLVGAVELADGLAAEFPAETVPRDIAVKLMLSATTIKRDRIFLDFLFMPISDASLSFKLKIFTATVCASRRYLYKKRANRTVFCV